MTDSIRHSIEAPIAHCGSNSLSPEPCVLSPVLLHASSVTGGAPRPVDNPLAAATADDRTGEYAKSGIGRWA